MCTLINETRRKLVNRPRTKTMEEIAEQAEVSITWLSRFANNRVPEPGASKVQRLYEVLSEHPLKV